MWFLILYYGDTLEIVYFCFVFILDFHFFCVSLQSQSFNHEQRAQAVKKRVLDLLLQQSHCEIVFFFF